MKDIVKTDASKMQRNLMIAKDHISGMTYNQLAKKYDIHNATVSRILNKDEIREVLNEALNHLVTFAPIVVKNFRDMLQSDNKQIQQKATFELSKMLGLSPSHTPTQINLLFNQTNNNVILSDTMRDILTKINGNDDFIDAEFSAIIDD